MVKTEEKQAQRIGCLAISKRKADALGKMFPV